MNHLRETAAGPPLASVNGRVVKIEPGEDGDIAVIEFSPRPGTVERFRTTPAAAERRQLELNGQVIVNFDASNPVATARVFSIRRLWLDMMRRLFGGGLCLVGAVILWLRSGRRYSHSKIA